MTKHKQHLIENVRVRINNPYSGFHNVEGIVRSISNFEPRGEYLNVRVRFPSLPWPFTDHAVKFTPSELIVL